MVDVPADMPVTTPLLLIVATDVVLLLHVPPDVASASGELPPTHIVSVPVIGLIDEVDSVSVVDVLFHRSPGSSVLLPFTAFRTVRIVTVPDPAAGAVHGIFTVYIVPVAPVPLDGDSAEECSHTLIELIVLMWLPVGAVIVPALLGVLPFTAVT
jgi:hypothetical protein